MTDSPDRPRDTRDILRRVALLSELPDDLVSGLATQGRRISVGRGEALVREGDPADTLYFILQGRFLVQSGQTSIAELSVGEPIGEIAFFAGGTRTATVTALRAAEVLALDRPTYDTLARQMPALGETVIRALARRVVAGNPQRSGLEPRAGATICLRAVTGGTLPEGIVARLAGAAALGPDLGVLTARDALTAQALSARIGEAEARGRRLLFVVEDPSSDWARVAAASADTVLLVARAEAAPMAPDATERALLSGTLPQHVHLAVMRSRADQPITGTQAWLTGRDVGLHHHVALDRDPDFERLARFVAGRAMGLVYSGGGAFGCAHLGMLKALEEHGHVFDMVGGASMGAAMAGGYALGLRPDAIMDMLEELFLRSGAMKRYTVPRWSVVDHRFFDSEVARLTRHADIADLPLPFFAAATSLTDNTLKTLRTGPLWQAIRASTAIPAVFPPMVLEDGEVLIDGGLMDNTPLGPMRDLKPGPNIVMDMARPTGWRVQTPYSALPGRGGALRQMLLPFGRKTRFPGIFSILSRTMLVNSDRRLAQIDRREDVFLTMPPLPRMGFLQWEKGRALFEQSYATMSDRLAAGGGGTGDLAALQAAAERAATTTAA